MKPCNRTDMARAWPEWVARRMHFDSARWTHSTGGNLRIEREGNDLIVTFNSVADRRRVLAHILEQLAEQGVLPSAVAL